MAPFNTPRGQGGRPVPFVHSRSRTSRCGLPRLGLRAMPSPCQRLQALSLCIIAGGGGTAFSLPAAASAVMSLP